MVECRKVIQIGTGELSSTPFSIGFSPGLVKGKPPIKVTEMAFDSSSSPHSGWVGVSLVLFFVLPLAYGLIWLISRSAHGY